MKEAFNFFIQYEEDGDDFERIITGMKVGSIFMSQKEN